MSTGELLALGAIAGATIFLGLPMGRMRRPRPGLQAFLNAAAIGILTFLLYDVLAHAVDPVNAALTKAHAGHGTWWRFTGLVSTFTLALALGLLSLVYFDRWRGRKVAVDAAAVGSGPAAAPPPRDAPSPRDAPPPPGEGPARPFGPGAAAIEELAPPSGRSGHHLSPGGRLAVLIAMGIGLHNFSEGLAIGQAANANDTEAFLAMFVLMPPGWTVVHDTPQSSMSNSMRSASVKPRTPNLAAL